MCTAQSREVRVCTAQSGECVYVRAACVSDKVTKNEMGRGLGVYGREDKCVQGLSGEILGEISSKT